MLYKPKKSQKLIFRGLKGGSLSQHAHC